MHSVLLRLQHQAEVFKEMEKMRREWYWRKMEVYNNRPKICEAFKKLGLWNMHDEDFYANNKIFEQTLTITNMCLLYALFGARYYRKMKWENPEIFDCVDEIPIVCLNPGEYVYELKAPFTKEFFENLIKNECNILEFGTDYAFFMNGKLYGTTKLFDLFINQNFPTVYAAN